MKPKRLRRGDYKVNLPANSVVVQGMSRFANPFKATKVITKEKAVSLYRQAIESGELRTGKGGRYPITPEYIREHLRGKDLVCTCGLDEPCHADVLLEIANS